MIDHARNLHITLESRGEPWRRVKVRRVSGREAISDLFAFDVDLVCDLGCDLPEDAASPGAEVCVVVEADGVEVRRVYGAVASLVDHLEAPSDRLTYRLRIVPRVHRLALVQTQEIFQDLSVPEVIAAKLSRHGFGQHADADAEDHDFEMRLLATYPAREFIVQYQETDLAFVRRLAEHQGISFFFEHDRGRDKLVFTDYPGGFRPIDGASEVSFRARNGLHVSSLELRREVAPTTYVVQDYNHRVPRVSPVAHHSIESGSGGGVVEFGGHVKTPEEAAELARIRAEERLSQQNVYSGASSCVALAAGRRFTLLDHPRLSGPDGDLLPIEVVHELSVPLFDDDPPAACRNTFRAVAATTAYRPPRTTRKPRIPGLVTGIVQTGPNGETGSTARLDAEGRYTVAFHFDITDTGAAKASRPVRLAQPFGGMGHGMHFPLRPGTEVAVGFVNGDPDRPVIVGALYNAESPSPVAARNATINRITTASGALFEISEKR